MPAATKVSRDGTVTRDGETIGRVEKVMRQGIFATEFGVSVSGGGTPYWIPFAADGTQLHEYGYDTRKRAVSLVERNAEPMTVSDIAVVDGWSGRYVKLAVSYKGYYFGATRYAHESAWVVDFYCTPASICPVFSNGEGTRYTSAKVLTGEADKAATDAAGAAGVWPLGGAE